MKKQRNLKSQIRMASCRTTKTVSSTMDLPFAKAYLSSLVDDAFSLLQRHYSFTDATRDRAALLKRLDFEGLSFATKTLPSLFNNILTLLEHGESSFPQFKLKKGTNYPVMFHRLIHLACCSGDVSIRNKSFDILYSICYAFKKLKGSYSNSILKQQWLDFVDVDRSLGDINWFEDTTYFILTYARQCCREIFHNVQHDDPEFLPTPGPGATNTKTEKTERYAPHVLYETIDKHFPYTDWFYPTPWDVCLQSRTYLDLVKKRQVGPRARFKQVPKTYGKARGICIEENEMQVFQQAMRRGLATIISRNSALRSCLPLDDQSINADIALRSSSSKDFGTIDMSEASDRVSRELVSWIFQDTPLHDPLMSLSTRFIDAPTYGDDEIDHVLKTQKYAPMGSGLCFPIMSLIHLFLIRGIIFYAYPKEHDLWKSVKVYGDDIIAPSHIIESIYEHLPRFGMKLNVNKSFYKCNFRESCGVHAYHGVDVTPAYVKYTPNPYDLRTVVSGIAVESLLYKKGFLATAKLFRDKLGLKDSIPSIPRQSLACIQRTNSDERVLREQKSAFRSRWNRDLQCYEFFVPRIQKRCIPRKIRIDEHAYLRWFWTHTEKSRVIDDSYGDHILVRKWVPESAL